MKIADDKLIKAAEHISAQVIKFLTDYATFKHGDDYYQNAIGLLYSFNPLRFITDDAAVVERIEEIANETRIAVFGRRCRTCRKTLSASEAFYYADHLGIRYAYCSEHQQQAKLQQRCTLVSAANTKGEGVMVSG